MDLKSSWSSSFEFEDIEIIAHKKEDEEKSEKWYCDQCSLFFLEKGKLDEHKKKHSVQEIVNCKYCNKTLSSSEVNSDCYINRKCETCEYKCSKCPQRFLRHSSLMNHEKKHSSPKKKRGVSNNKKINGICPENVASSKGVKRRRIDTDDSEEQPKRLKTRNVEKIQKKKINPQVKTKVLDGNNSSIKTPKRSLLKARKSAEETNNCENVPVKVAERLSLKTTNLPEGKVGNKHKHNTTTINSLTSPTPNMSSNENVVNYKPFSCHVCGDTFASDSALLGHIRTHGENAVKSFKCKYCGDEFDDVYKMQYHLAICPLAEDELETSLKQAIPVKLPIKYGGETCSPRKRGRPKKKVEMTSDQESYENKLSPSSCNKVNVKKRKSEVLENNGTVPKQSKKSQSIEPLTDPNEPLPCDVAEITKEKEVDDDKKKLHHCPFPRCDFKFTREKALLCHMRNHSDDFDDSLKCHKCDIPFDDIQTLRLHINECKGIKEEKDDDFNQPYRADCYDTSPSRTIQRSRKDFVCNGCGRSYQSQEKLDRCTHEDLQRGYVICRICSLKIEDGKKLKKHFSSTHPKSLPYQCPTCNAEFDSALAEHEHRLAHVVEENMFACLICSAKFPTYKDLYFHYSKDHVEQSQSICKICNITFPNRMVLEEHNYAKHKSNDRFKCIFCNKAYSSSVSLTVHLKKHTTKIYKCKICYRPFTDTATLFQHMLFHASTIGTEKPLKCGICLAAYAKHSGLKYHISGHVAKNSFSFHCTICQELMPDDESLINHIFDHSIRITENNMTKSEIEWVGLLKERRPVLKRGRCSLTSNYDPEFKPSVKVEKDEPDLGSYIRIDSGKTPPIKRGRGRPKKIKIEKDESPEQIKGKGRLRKHGKTQKTTIETKPVTQISEGTKKITQLNHIIRRSGRLEEKNNSGEINGNNEVKEKKGKQDMVLKSSKQNNSRYENLPTTKATQRRSDITNVSKVKREWNLSATESRSDLRTDSLKQKKPLTINDDYIYDCDYEVLEKDSNTSNKNSNNTNISRNKPIKGAEIQNVSNVCLSGCNNETVPLNENLIPLKKTEVSDILENKVRPLSFKMFSSLTNSRIPKLVNKELRTDELAKKELQDGKQSLVDSNSVGNEEEIYDNEEDPLGGIEIPYVSARKGLRSSSRICNGNHEWDISLNAKEEENPLKCNESDEYKGNESNWLVEERKYFDPLRGLTKYGCTTCVLSFSSQEELLLHNSTHI